MREPFTYWQFKLVDTKPMLVTYPVRRSEIFVVKPDGTIDLDLFTQAWLSEWPQQEFEPAADFIVDDRIDFHDYAKFAIGFKMNVP